MANFDFWQWADPSEVDQMRATDFERQATESINKANADLWGRDAGQLLDQSRNQIGDMIGNTLNSVRSAVAEPVQRAVEPVQRAVQGGQQAADQFSEWAGSRLGEVRSKLPGYDALDQPSTTPARDDWRVGDQPAEPAQPPAVASEGSGSALLDALNEHTSGGTSPAKVTVQPDSAPPKPVDQPFPPDTTVTRDDYRKEWRPQLYQETPNAIPPWSGQDRGTVNPGLAPLDNALRQVQDLFSGSRANPNPGQSQYNGLYTDPSTYGGNAVSATPHQIGINARDHLVGVMRDYWQSSGGKEPDSDQGLSSIARVLTESMAHEVAHDTDAEHSRVHAATTKQISQQDGSAGYQTIYNALKQMRDAGSLKRVVETAKAGTSPNPNEIAPPRTAQASVSPLERSGDSGSPLLDALNAHTQQQDNPDQPSGLSDTPKESVTPTFTPADLETGNTQNGMVDPGQAARDGVQGAHDLVKTAVDFGLGAQAARDAEERIAEIDQMAVDQGYRGALSDRRFEQDHPELVQEYLKAATSLYSGMAGTAPEMRGATPAHLAGAGEALRKIPGVQKVGEVLGGLRDAVRGATPESPAPRPSPLDQFADTPLSPHEPGTPMATPLPPEDLPEGFKPGQVGSTAPDLPRGNPDDAAAGAKTWAASVEDPNKRYDFHYEVRPLYGLTTSHTDAFTPHPDFPAELQPRLRDRAASRDQINRIAGSLSPDALLAETHRLDSGPPIIGPDGVVESGNGRTLALRLAQQEHPEQYAAYQQALRDRADELGIDPAALERMQNPVLVRVRDSEVDRPKFAAEANQPAVLEMGSFETALQDARRLSPDTLAGLDVGESQSIDQALLSAGNRDIVRGIVASIPANERASMMTETGELSRSGLERIKAALFASTYPDEAGQRLARIFFESPDPNVRNIQNGILQSLPAMARAEGLIKNGERDAALSLSDDLARAVDVYARLRNQGLGVGEYLGQASMFDRELSPLQEQLLGHLDTLSRSPRRIRDFVQRYADSVEAQPVEGQAGLFGDVPRASKEELLRQASGGALDVGENTVAPTATARGGLEEPGPREVPTTPGGAPGAPARLPAESRAERLQRRAESASVGQEASTEAAAAQGDPYTHAVGTGYVTGASPQLQAQLDRATTQREYGRVSRQDSHEAGVALALDQRSMEALEKRINREGATRQGAAEVDALRERAVGAIENVRELQAHVDRLQRVAEEGGQPDIIDQLTAADRLLTAARDSAALSLGSARRYAEAAGRTLSQFQYKISAQAAQKVAARVEQLSDLAKRSRLAIDVKPGRQLTRRQIDGLEQLGEQLPTDGALLGPDAGPLQDAHQRIRQASRANGRVLPEDQTLAEQLGALEREHATAHGDSAAQTEIGSRREALLEQIRAAAEERAQAIADAQGKAPKDLSPEEIERAINQAIGAPTVTTLNNDALAAERKARGVEAVKDPIRAAVDQFRTGERTAIKADSTIAKYWSDQVIQFPDDAGIRQAAHDAFDTIATHGQAGQQRAEAARAALATRLGKSYDALMAGVKSRNDAEVLRQIKAEDRANTSLMAGVERRNQDQIIHYAKQFDRLQVDQLAGDIREFVAAARKNPDMLAIKDAFGESRLQKLSDDLALVSDAGQERASKLREQLYKTGILHLAQKSAKDMDQTELDGLVKALGNVKSPEDLAALVRTIRQPRLLDYLYEIQYVNMLSSPVTHITNAAANLAQLAGRLAFNPLTVAGDVLLNPGKRVTSSAEVGAAWHGAASGLGEGLRGAAHVMRTGERPGASQQALELGSLSGVNREYLTERFGPLGTALHLISSRPLEAMDVLIGHIAYASAVEQGATGVAKRSGTTVEQVMRNIWDHPEVLEQAGKVRDYTLLRGAGDSPVERWLRQGAALRNAPADAGFARQALAFVGNQALPFFNVPLHYTKQGLDRSLGAPINTVRMLTEQDPAMRSELFKRAAVGYGTLATALVLASGDNLTGDGPSDPTARATWQATHQPNSVRLPGTDRWYSYQSTPWGIPFAIVANAREGMEEAGKRAEKKSLPPFETASALVQGAGRGAVSGIVNQTFLQNLSQMYGQMTGTQDAFPAIVTGTAARFVQPSLLRWYARITDSMERDATHGGTTQEQISQRMAAGYPGAREKLPVARDVLGQPRTNQSTGLSGLLPLALQGRTASASKSPVLAEYRRLDLNFPAAQVDKLGDTPLSPTQQRQYRDSAQAIRGQLTERLLASDTYKKADDEARKRLLQAATSRASAWAGQALAPSSDREGYEFTTEAVGGDPARAVDGYLKAVALQEQLKQAQATRYLGVKGPAAEQLMGDVRELGAFRQALGKARADMEFVRKYGAARYAKADGAQVDPRYDLLRQRIQKDPNYATYFGSRAVLDLGR